MIIKEAVALLALGLILIFVVLYGKDVKTPNWVFPVLFYSILICIGFLCICLLYQVYNEILRLL